MGFVKEGMIRDQENRAMAADYLVTKGLLQRCEAHGEIYGGAGWDIEREFWRNAMADRKRGINGPVPWAEHMEAREFTDLLEVSYKEYCGDECGSCAKYMAE